MFMLCQTSVNGAKTQHMTAEEMNQAMHQCNESTETKMSVEMSETCTDQGEHVMLKPVKVNKHDMEDTACNDGDGVLQREVRLQLRPHSKWRLLSHLDLPEWLRGNPFLSHYHRPPMPSFGFCFKSIFKIHTETGNIWTHLIGFVAFVCITMYMYLRPITTSAPFPKDWQEKLVFGSFFACGILCLGCSWIFHTVHCHSKTVSKIFRR